MEKKCVNCGSAIDGENKFCPYCGTKIKEEGIQEEIKPNKDLTCEENYNKKLSNASENEEYVPKSISIYKIVGTLIIILALIFLGISPFIKGDNGANDDKSGIVYGYDKNKKLEILFANNQKENSNKKDGINIADYQRKDAKRLIKEFPYKLHQDSDGKYKTKKDDITITLNKEETRIQEVCITANYEKLNIYGLQIGMSRREINDYILNKKCNVIGDDSTVITMDTKTSTTIICIYVSEGKVSCILIYPGMNMDSLEKTSKEKKSIKKVQDFKNSEMNSTYNDSLNRTLGDLGTWSCSLSMGNLYGEENKKYVFYTNTAEHTEIIWTLDENNEVTLKSVVLQGNKLKSNKELIECIDTDSMEDILTGIWHNGEKSWATNYHTIFYSDGTVEHMGYRSRDIGYYEITGDYTATANFDEYIDWAGSGYQYMGSYKCYYTYNSETKCLERRLERFYDNYGDNDGDGDLVKVDKMVEDSEDY